MCGIAALTGPCDEALLESLGAALHHRGPDGGGVFRGDGAALVARRLAILDLPGGEQPMVSDDGLSAIAFNGEIYNVRELKRSLEAEGVRFSSDHSDTELVLRLYETRGLDALSELNGMFAFAILDGRRRRLVAARDRFGIKPLYYARLGGRFALASELRTLLRVPGVERELDRESLWHYLTLRFVPGERSILAGVHRLPPGHLLELDLDTGALDVRRWYRLEFAPDAGPSRAEWAERLREALGAAVGRWSLSDVPIACSLSGGLDSSAVVALLAQSGAAPATYSLGFSDDDGELPLARALAGRYGTDHHEIVVDPDELLRDLLSMVWALDEPYGGGLPSWYVFRFMSEDVKVGADRLRRRRALRQLPALRPVRAGTARALPGRRRAPLPHGRRRTTSPTARRPSCSAPPGPTPRRCCSGSTTRAAAAARATRCSTSTSRRSCPTSSSR